MSTSYIHGATNRSYVHRKLGKLYSDVLMISFVKGQGLQ